MRPEDVVEVGGYRRGLIWICGLGLEREMLHAGRRNCLVRTVHRVGDGYNAALVDVMRFRVLGCEAGAGAEADQAVCMMWVLISNSR